MIELILILKIINIQNFIFGITQVKKIIMVKYWWVNQNKTYEAEVSGGYMWSPKVNKNGGFNKFYDFMVRTKSGDSGRKNDARK